MPATSDEVSFMDEMLDNYKDERVIMVCFWSKSCHICMEEVKDVVQISKKYNDVGILFVHRPINEGDLYVDKVLEVAGRIGIDEGLYFDNDHSIGDGIELNGLPFYAVYDKNKKLLKKFFGANGLTLFDKWMNSGV